MKEYKFKIDTKLPSLNEYINACRRNAYSGGNFKKDTDMICSVFIRKAKIPEIKSPVHIRFEWHESTQKRDLDNVAGYGHKTILDALVSCGCLKDDSPKHVKGFTDDFVKDKKCFCVVTITELE